jgi:hypothetical protein
MSLANEGPQALVDAYFAFRTLLTGQTEPDSRSDDALKTEQRKV